jgi:hypothetical protein
MASNAARALGTRPVTVYVPGQGANDLKSVQKIVANTLKRLGCGACLSGLDIRLRQVEELVVDPRTLDIGERFG